MLTSMPVAVIAGLLTGFLAGLGVGGGSILILWLTIVAGIDQSIARSINLMFFITAAGAVSVLRWKKGTLPFQQLLPAMIAGCVAAVIFSYLRAWISTELVKKLFGCLLLVTGIKELFYRPRNAR